MFDCVDTFSVLFKYIIRMTAFPGYDVEGVTSFTCTGTPAFIISWCNFLNELRKSCLLLMSQFVQYNST